MNRRRFTSLAIAGLGLAAARPAWAQTVVDPTREALLARARRSLERHRTSFALRDRIAIADFAHASYDRRLHIVDLISGVTTSYLVAHGRGSDPGHTGWLERFSNEPASLATSSGAYITGEIYDGQHGASMRLRGLDPANTNAEPRAIVIHGAWYVCPEHIRAYGKIGRSDGCFAVEPTRLHEILGLLGPGRMLYADRAWS